MGSKSPKLRLLWFRWSLLFLSHAWGKGGASTKSRLLCINVLLSPVKNFDLKEEIEKLEKSPRRDLQVVGYYLSEKKPDIRNHAQFQVTIKRHLRAAGKVSAFEDDQIVRVLKLAKELLPKDFTIETLYKLLTK